MAAIYQWFTDEEVIVTTTLFPIEFQETMQLDVTIDSGHMWEVMEESYDFSSSMLDGLMRTIRIDLPEIEEAYDFSSSMLDGVMNTIRSDLPEIEEAYNISSSMLDGVMQNKLVPADTPDEKLQLDCAIDPSGCSMTPI